MLEIEQLILRIPNISPEEGRQMSYQIVQRLSEHIPLRSPNRHIEQLDMQIRLSENLSNNQMVDRISTAILQRISDSHAPASNLQAASNFSSPTDRKH